MRVGMFDSGIGGLSILKSFLDEHPNNEYIYFGDTLNMPYGEKSKEELLNLGRNIIRFLISKKVDVIIIACGTLSSLAYKELKKEFNVPIYDIITPIVESLKETNVKRVLLLGTEKTIESREFERKLLSNKINVERCSCPKFAPIIEGKIKDDLYIAIQEYLYDFKGMNIDLIIPGCTHYPIIGDEISKYLEIDMLDIGLILCKKIEIKYSISGLEIFFSKLDKETEKITRAIIGDCVIKEKELS